MENKSIKNLNSGRKLFLLIVVTILLMNSCTIQNRIYRPGYNIGIKDFRPHKVKNETLLSDNETSKIHVDAFKEKKVEIYDSENISSVYARNVKSDKKVGSSHFLLHNKIMKSAPFKRKFILSEKQSNIEKFRSIGHNVRTQLVQQEYKKQIQVTVVVGLICGIIGLIFFFWGLNFGFIYLELGYHLLISFIIEMIALVLSIYGMNTARKEKLIGKGYALAGIINVPFSLGVMLFGTLLFLLSEMGGCSANWG